ncbi:hypothetical protein WR25_14142 [Diploscapter pachys]|uniref:Transmembrane protein adipocyte-associated 1 homolog n=1 Tax=Diploscapter pachys TaxID=2018661 RepID=A0A2A2KPE7_9BILA|nr:hypothetical protein WR25_14142 [Diploscapter pachys]
MSVISSDNPASSFSSPANNSEQFAFPGEDDLSPEWLQEVFNSSFLDGETHKMIKGFCYDALQYTVPYLGIRYWDLSVLLPNVLFLLFLIVRCGRVMKKLKSSRSPVFKAFFVLIYLCTLVNVARSLLAFSISTANPLGDFVHKILSISLKFFYMTAELSVLMFALLFGHLDSGSSIRRALVFTLILSMFHAGLQAIIDFDFLPYIDKSWFPSNDLFDLETDAGILLWMGTSMVFAMLYLFIILLPLTCFRNYVTMPSKTSFYIYCISLSILNLVQLLGSSLIFFGARDGMCFVDLSTLLYFCFFSPLVYFTFLRRSLKILTTRSGDGLFSYRKQKDESGSGELPDSYYPRFSGLTSSSYDDLFDCTRDAMISHHYNLDRPDYMQHPYEAPLMTTDTAESTVTNGSEDGADGHLLNSNGNHRHSALLEPRILRGLGSNGALVFSDEPSNRWSTYR